MDDSSIFYLNTVVKPSKINWRMLWKTWPILMPRRNHEIYATCVDLFRWISYVPMKKVSSTCGKGEGKVMENVGWCQSSVQNLLHVSKCVIQVFGIWWQFFPSILQMVRRNVPAKTRPEQEPTKTPWKIRKRRHEFLDVISRKADVNAVWHGSLREAWQTERRIISRTYLGQHCFLQYIPGAIWREPCLNLYVYWASAIAVVKPSAEMNICWSEDTSESWSESCCNICRKCISYTRCCIRNLCFVLEVYNKK